MTMHLPPQQPRRDSCSPISILWFGGPFIPVAGLPVVVD